MHECGGGEETANDGDQNSRNHGDGLRGLQEATRSGQKFQIPGADNDGRGRRLASGGGKPAEVEEELVTAETDPWQGRGGQEDIGDVFQSGGSTGAAVRGRGVSADPTDREGTGQIYAWGREKDHGETAAERVGW